MVYNGCNYLSIYPLQREVGFTNHVSKRGHWSQRCSIGFISGRLDGQSLTSMSWFSRKLLGLGLYGAEHYFGPELIVLEGGSCPG